MEFKQQEPGRLNMHLQGAESPLLGDALAWYYCDQSERVDVAEGSVELDNAAWLAELGANLPDSPCRLNISVARVIDMAGILHLYADRERSIYEKTIELLDIPEDRVGINHAIHHARAVKAERMSGAMYEALEVCAWY